MSLESNQISPLELAIIKVLAYYHMFHHPLLLKEIKDRLNSDGFGDELLKETINNLVEAGAVSEYLGYYFLEDENSIVNRRQEGEVRAQKLMKIARLMSKLIYSFPFVRGVFISGSLSKGAVHEDTDIDYFIVTKRNRLWIARTLLVLFKRLFLLGSKKYFCINYFVDEDHLEIPDKNIFTATEVSTLIPMQGHSFTDDFITKNMWYKNFFPNVTLPKITSQKPMVTKWISKTIIEPLFFNIVAERLDRYFMRKTYKRWTQLYVNGYSEAEFELAFRSRRGTSKNHNRNYQKRVLNKVEENVNKAIQSYKLEIIDG